MSAKSVKGPGGKKPASAATNLIGIPKFVLKTPFKLTRHYSWWWSRHDGSIGLSSARSVRPSHVDALIDRTFRYNQGPNAVIETEASAWSERACPINFHSSNLDRRPKLEGF